MRTHVRHVPRPRTIWVRQATMIPDGMHGAAPLVGGGMLEIPRSERKAIVESMVAKLVASGVPEARARAIVARARDRHLARGHALAPGYNRKRAGMGDDAAVDSSVLARAQDTQTRHKALLDAYGAASSDSDRQDVRNQLDALYNDWTQYAVGVEGGAAPYQWSRTDPTAAILIAVRDDLANTNSLIDSGKAQAALQKNIVASWKAQGSLPSGPSLSVDVPWYVWAGGAVAGGLALRKIFG